MAKSGQCLLVHKSRHRKAPEGGDSAHFGVLRSGFFVKLSPLISITVNVVSLVFVYKLAAALKMPSPWQYVVFTLTPCAGITSLLVLNGHATSALKARGIRVGLMGARQEDLARIGTDSEKIETPPTDIV